MFKDSNPKRCALIVIADGFEETETFVFLSFLRRAGLCVKSVGLTSGLVSSAHGVRLMPDLTFSDLDSLTRTTAISAIILPEGRKSLDKLETDPRVHRLLRQVVAQSGQIVTGRDGLRVPRVAAVWAGERGESNDNHRMPVLLREPGQSLEAFAQELARRLKQSPRP